MIDVCIGSINEWIFSKTEIFRSWCKRKVELSLSSYATTGDLKNATGVDTSDFTGKADLAHLKSDVDISDNDKLKNVPSHLSNLKSKVDKLDIEKLETTPFDLSKLSDIVKN